MPRVVRHTAVRKFEFWVRGCLVGACRAGHEVDGPTGIEKVDLVGKKEVGEEEDEEHREDGVARVRVRFPSGHVI